MPVTIRCGGLNDVAAMLEVEQRAVGAAHWTGEQYHKLIEGGVVLVAEENGRYCGFICAKAVLGEWEIENIVVSGECLRRGIGSRLLRDLLRRADKAAASAILLEVRESNVAARGLYEKHGFREVGRRRMYYKDPPEDAVLYRLRIDG